MVQRSIWVGKDVPKSLIQCHSRGVNWLTSTRKCKNNIHTLYIIYTYKFPPDNIVKERKTICRELLIFSPWGSFPNLWGICGKIEFVDNKPNLRDITCSAHLWLFPPQFYDPIKFSLSLKAAVNFILKVSGPNLKGIKWRLNVNPRCFLLKYLSNTVQAVSTSWHSLLVLSCSQIYNR